MIKGVENRVQEIFAGDIYVHNDENTIISTLLGSCIAVCLFDNKNSVYGMNHFMLPDKNYKRAQDKLGKYGVDALELLVKDMLKQGAVFTNLKAKIFGGGGEVTNIIYDNVSRANIEFTQKALQNYSIPILAQDVGGRYGRQIYLLPNGDVYVRRFKPKKP